MKITYSILKVSILFFSIAALTFLFFNSSQKKAPLDKKNGQDFIAITKIVSHPSLDAIEKGVVDELKAQGIHLEVHSDNAQGNMATAVQIAQKLLGEEPRLIIPITTPSAQAAYNTLRHSGIPIVFAAVSDPVGAKLIDPETRLGKGITGVSDVSPLQDQLDLIKKIQPSLENLAILYNPGEANSVSIVQMMKELSEPMGIKIIEATCPNTAEVSTVAQSIIGSAQAIYIPNDNTIVSALEGVLRVAKNKLPVYAADPDSVQKGCLAATALSQYNIGRETGKVAARVLQGESPDSIPIVIPTKVETVINGKAADSLGIVIPNDLQSFVMQKEK